VLLPLNEKRWTLDIMNYATIAGSYQLRQPILIAFKALSQKKNSRNHAMKLNIISTFINPKEV
jgi:hypothetical protein